MTARKHVEKCTACPFGMCGEVWSPVCMAPRDGKQHMRRLPRDHDFDGPPPAWCPLPIIVSRPAVLQGTRPEEAS